MLSRVRHSAVKVGASAGRPTALVELEGGADLLAAAERYAALLNPWLEPPPPPAASLGVDIVPVTFQEEMHAQVFTHGASHYAAFQVGLKAYVYRYATGLDGSNKIVWSAWTSIGTTDYWALLSAGAAMRFHDWDSAFTREGRLTYGQISGHWDSFDNLNYFGTDQNAANLPLAESVSSAQCPVLPLTPETVDWHAPAAGFGDTSATAGAIFTSSTAFNASVTVRANFWAAVTDGAPVGEGEMVGGEDSASTGAVVSATHEAAAEMDPALPLTARLAAAATGLAGALRSTLGPDGAAVVTGLAQLAVKRYVPAPLQAPASWAVAKLGGLLEVRKARLRAVSKDPLWPAVIKAWRLIHAPRFPARAETYVAANDADAYVLHTVCCLEGVVSPVAMLMTYRAAVAGARLERALIDESQEDPVAAELRRLRTSPPREPARPQEPDSSIGGAWATVGQQ